jgi:hypothetical protein
MAFASRVAAVWRRSRRIQFVPSRRLSGREHLTLAAAEIDLAACSDTLMSGRMTERLNRTFAMIMDRLYQVCC